MAPSQPYATASVKIGKDKGDTVLTSLDIQPAENGWIVRCERRSKATKNGMDYRPSENKVFTDKDALLAFVKKELG